METNKNQKSVLSVFYDLFLIIISSVLFWLSNPNQFFHDGLGFIAFFNYLPVLFLIKRAGVKSSLLYGGFFGTLSYALYSYWLQNFHPLGLIIVLISYFFIYAVFFLILKFCNIAFLRIGWFVQFLCICAFEYLKTLGFFGINYGVTAYTQWKNIYFIQICDIIGVFGLNILVIFPSVFLFSYITKSQQRNRIYNDVDYGKKTHISAYVNKEIALRNNSLFFTKLSGVLWLLAIIFSYLYGFLDIRNTNFTNYVKVAAIQHNQSPWRGGVEEYSKDLQTLISLTEDAQSLEPELDFIIWPETAFVPSVVYQFYYGKDARRVRLVNLLLDFINNNNSVFVIGNPHEINVNKATRDRYNSVLVFEGKKNVIPPKPDIYSKIKLVPFTEYFPMKHLFPGLYMKLLNGDLNMWEMGQEYKVFNRRGINFSTPVCFEDTFSFVCRNMVKNGSRCFFNLSNDSWSDSISCQKQHLAMAVFRSVENGVPCVRSTASGETCVIDTNGNVTNIAPEFCKAYVIGKVPVVDENKITVYSKYGDIPGNVQVLSCLIILLIKSITIIIKKIQNHK